MGKGFAMKVVHAGEGKGKPYDAVTMPIVQTSTSSSSVTPTLSETPKQPLIN